MYEEKSDGKKDDSNKFLYNTLPYLDCYIISLVLILFFSTTVIPKECCTKTCSNHLSFHRFFLHTCIFLTLHIFCIIFIAYTVDKVIQMSLQLVLLIAILKLLSPRNINHFPITKTTTILSTLSHRFWWCLPDVS